MNSRKLSLFSSTSGRSSLGVLGLEGAHLVVVVVLVEVDGVAPGVVEYAVQDDRDADLLGVGAQALERLQIAEHRVDPHIVARVVAVVARGLEDRVEVDAGNAQGLEVAKLLAHALEVSTIEVPRGDATVLVLAIVGLLAPVEHKLLRRALAPHREACVHALLPTRAALEAVREDLVDHALLIPARLYLAMLVDRDLEGARIAVFEGAHADARLRTRAIAPYAPDVVGDVERVPDDLALFRRERPAQAHDPLAAVEVFLGTHVNEGCTVPVDP